MSLLEENLAKLAIGFFVLQILFGILFIATQKWLFLAFTASNLMLILPYVFPAESRYVYGFTRMTGDLGLIPSVTALTYYALTIIPIQIPTIATFVATGAVGGILLGLSVRFIEKSKKSTTALANTAISFQIRKCIPRVPIADPMLGTEDFDRRWDEAQASTYQRWEKAEKDWKETTSLTIERRLLLIAASIPAEKALSPEITSLTDEDLQAMAGLMDMEENESWPFQH